MLATDVQTVVAIEAESFHDAWNENMVTKFLVEFSCEAIWTWAFVCWKIFDYSFNFRACDGSVKIFYFFLIEFWKVVLF